MIVIALSRRNFSVGGYAPPGYSPIRHAKRLFRRSQFAPSCVRVSLKVGDDVRRTPCRPAGFAGVECLRDD
jgi:hypothetical protein